MNFALLLPPASFFSISLPHSGKSVTSCCTGVIQGPHYRGHGSPNLSQALHRWFALGLAVSSLSEKAMATHFSTLAWKIPWMEEPGGLQSMGSLRVGHDWVTSLSCIGEGNGNPLQCSCLENPRDGGAWLGCRLWHCTESDTTEATRQQQQLQASKKQSKSMLIFFIIFSQINLLESLN